MSSKGFAERDQQGSGAIRARAVREDQCVAVWILGRVQKAADRGVQRIIGKWDGRMHRIETLDSVSWPAKTKSRSFASLRLIRFGTDDKI